jgi:hypothetical protein
MPALPSFHFEHCMKLNIEVLHIELAVTLLRAVYGVNVATSLTRKLQREVLQNAGPASHSP